MSHQLRQEDMATSNIPKHFILTGSPGIGKTTLVLNVCEILKTKGVCLRGFYTREERDHGKRTGFSVVTLDGEIGTLAKVEAEAPGHRGPRVGQYSVKLHSFETVALPSLKAPGLKESGDIKSDILVIDEIGKMELFSQSFVTAVKSMFKADVTILATIPVAKGKPIPLVEQIRARADVQLFTVTRENRNQLLETIVEAIMQKRCAALS